MPEGENIKISKRPDENVNSESVRGVLQARDSTTQENIRGQKQQKKQKREICWLRKRKMVYGGEDQNMTACG
jgi:hypothetical protein